MSHPIAYANNRMETGIVTVLGSADGKPVTRLYDRFGVAYWEDTSSGTRTVKLDKGDAVTEIDAVIGSSTHNLAGLTLTAVHDDNSGFSSPTTLGTVVPVEGAPFRITGTASAEQYWKLTIASAGSAPRLGELFFSRSMTFPFGPSDRDLHRGKMANVLKQETESGVVLSFKRGATRWTSQLTIADISDTGDLPTFVQLFDDLDGGAKPFFYVDEDGALRFVEWVNPEVIGAANPLTSDVSIHLREALG